MKTPSLPTLPQPGSRPKACQHQLLSLVRGPFPGLQDQQFRATSAMDCRQSQTIQSKILLVSKTLTNSICKVFMTYKATFGSQELDVDIFSCLLSLSQRIFHKHFNTKLTRARGLLFTYKTIGNITVMSSWELSKSFLLVNRM